jgi:uncharacterized protein DUF6636
MDARIKSGHVLGAIDMRPSRYLVALPVLFCIGAAGAQTGPASFQSPSKNIACAYYGDDKQSTLRCDIAVMDTTPRRPPGCDLDYGQAFEMSEIGAAARICYGDTMIDKTLPVIGYGETWQRGDFTCKSEQSGITCRNADQHGFSLSRAKQQIF